MPNSMLTFKMFSSISVINGEKVAYCTPTFTEKRERTLGLLLKGVEQKCSTEVSEFYILILRSVYNYTVYLAQKQFNVVNELCGVSIFSL